MLALLLNDSKQGDPCSKAACLCLTCQVPSASEKTPNSSSPQTSVKLDSGAQARFSRDGEEWTLIVDGTPQSAVNPLDPRELSFGYIRHMGYVLDLAFPEAAAITALHLGAGALTIPRYVDATRPRSRQQVVELERSLVDFVREVVPLPAGASIRIRYGDAREQLGRLPRGLLGSVDAIVVDIFSGAQTPAHVTSAEFFSELEPFLRPDGVVLVNIADNDFANIGEGNYNESSGPGGPEGGAGWGYPLRSLMRRPLQGPGTRTSPMRRGATLPHSSPIPDGSGRRTSRR